MFGLSPRVRGSQVRDKGSDHLYGSNPLVVAAVFLGRLFFISEAVMQAANLRDCRLTYWHAYGR